MARAVVRRTRSSRATSTRPVGRRGAVEVPRRRVGRAVGGAGVGRGRDAGVREPALRPGRARAAARGASAEEVVERLTEADEGRDSASSASSTPQGRGATFTGPECHDWAGGRTGAGYAAQGNILVSGETVDALAETFEATAGPLAERLLDVPRRRAGRRRRPPRPAVGGAARRRARRRLRRALGRRWSTCASTTTSARSRSSGASTGCTTRCSAGRRATSGCRRRRAARGARRAAGALGHERLEDWAGVENLEERVDGDDADRPGRARRAEEDA